MSKVKMESLKGKTICFNLYKSTCFKLNSNVCSLDASDEIKMRYNYLSGRAHHSHCIWIRDNIIYPLNKKYLPLGLTQLKCGYYSSNNQHRICVAGHLGIEVPIIFYKSKSECKYCNLKGANAEDSECLKSF